MDAFWSFYESMPTVTRSYITACVLTTLAVQLDIISPFQLYFNFNLIFYHHQYWRLLTTFLFFGTFSFTFLFNIMFTYRYARMLEEGSFRSNSADFFFMLLFGAILMTIIAPFVKLLFLGHAFTIMLVYVWAKRNTQLQLSLFGLLNFRAPHLPWILLGFSLILGNSVLTDIMGICVGHIYYYLQDVFPHLPGGKRILKTPKIIVYLFNPTEYYLSRLNRDVNVIITEVIENVNSPQNNDTSLNENRTEQNPITSTINDQTISDETNEGNVIRNRTTDQSSSTKTDSSVSNDQKPTTSNQQHSHLD